MHYNISFPNLGIYLDHVGKSISIFGFSIAYYGMIIGAAILIGFLIATLFMLFFELRIFIREKIYRQRKE